ncbi:MAG: hypothetical protein NVSMB4_18080 [Acidimicrobiales bacterium]
MTFIEDYDMAVARMLYQGCDVWLNTPRRPLEACGTSGMKAALNGAINCSILDGWFDEMYDGENGWAVVSAERHDDLVRRDEAEGSSLFDLLESQIVPLFYDRRRGPTPQRWIERVKSSLVSLGPQVSASRMVRDYVTGIYEPSAARATALSEDAGARARELARWKAQTVDAWSSVKIMSVMTDDTVADLGSTRRVTANVGIGALRPDDVDVQLLHGPVGSDGELDTPTVVAMTQDGADPSAGVWGGELTCSRAGRYGYTVRVVPRHPDLASFAELGCVTWVS